MAYLLRCSKRPKTAGSTLSSSTSWGNALSSPLYIARSLVSGNPMASLIFSRESTPPGPSNVALRSSSPKFRFESGIYGDDIAISGYTKLNILDASQKHQCTITSGSSLRTAAFPRSLFPSGKSLLGCRNLSSQSGENSSIEDTDLYDEFSGLDAPPEADGIKEINVVEQHLVSESLDQEEDTSDSESVDGDLDLPGPEAEDTVKKGAIPSLFKVVMNASSQSLDSVLDRYVKDGHTVEHTELSTTMLNLRKRRLFGKALKLSEWLETSKHFEFVERDYASHLDLIAKVHGLYKAEKYIEKIPEGFRSEVIYRTLLANCVSAGHLKKSEELFNKMRDMGFPLTAFVCNQLLLLYKRLDRKRISNVLLMMENENVKPTNFTYRVLIEVKGRSNDIEGMEKVIESMNVEGVEPDIYVQATIARYYIYCGCKEKAEAVLKKIEGTNIKENRAACKVLLPLYAALEKADEVERIWNVCESHPRLDECIAAVEAWGRLGLVEKSEAVFEHTKKTWNKLSSRYYNALLRVYANHKCLTKGKELVKRMSNDGCKIGPVTWDALAKLYVGAGEVEKADSLLEKAAKQSHKSPMYASYLTVLEKYAKRGDVHNAEKIFHELRTSGYTGRMQMYQFLLEAYVTAKTPVYGFRERMKADAIFPNRTILGQLKTIDNFKKTEIFELLD